MNSNSEIETIEIRLLLEAIQARYGYDLRGYAWASVRRRVLTALAKSGLSHLSELQHRLLRDPVFFSGVFESLTVRATEMFRDPEFYHAFRSRVAPILRTYPLLKIWHSGCATGEEVYANAILLTEEGLYDRAQIYATDLSLQALEQAKEGVYSADHLGNFTENYARAGGAYVLSNYYTQAYDRIAVRDSLRKNVLFFQHDLVSDHTFGEMQVIFCRNVLIYFGQSLRDRVLHKMTQSLCPGGFFCLGKGERLPKRSEGPGALIEFDGNERIYRFAA